MGLFGKLFSLGKHAVGEQEKALDDKYGDKLFEQNIRDSKARLAKAEEAVEKHQAYVRVEGAEIESYREQREELESKIAQIRTKHDAHKEAGEDEKAAELLELAKRARKEVTKLDNKYKIKLEAFELAEEQLIENRELISEYQEEIERNELELQNVKANQELINMHKQADVVGDSLSGNGFDKSALEATKRRQAEQREQIKIRREKKKDSSSNLNSALDDALTDESSPW